VVVKVSDKEFNISHDAVEGNFGLAVGSPPTLVGPFAYDITAEQLFAAMPKSVKSVTGLGTSSNPWSIVFANPQQAGVSVTANNLLTKAAVDTAVTVVTTRPGVLPVDQTFAVWNDAVEGDFTFTVQEGGHTAGPTARIPARANATVLQQELHKLSLNNVPIEVEVTGAGTSSDPWLLNFSKPHHDITLLAEDDGLELAGGKVTVQQAVDEQAAVQTVTVDDSEGDFELVYDGQTTETLNKQSTADEVREALRALAVIDRQIFDDQFTELTVTSNDVGSWTITFVDADPLNVYPISANNVNLHSASLASPPFSATGVNFGRENGIQRITSVVGNAASGAFFASTNGEKIDGGTDADQVRVRISR
jgi:hypothetical protein